MQNRLHRLREAIMNDMVGNLPVITIPLPTFDLTEVCQALASDSRKLYGVELADEDIHELELSYRQFLAACKEHPTMSLEPTLGVDLLWHRHIVAMEQYGRDCNEYFGFVVIHDPKVAGPAMKAYSNFKGGATQASTRGIALAA